MKKAFDSNTTGLNFYELYALQCETDSEKTRSPRNLNIRYLKKL